MNAIEFVKKFGIEYAIKILNYDPSILDDVCHLDFGETKNLKQIVDAWELVEKVGGLERVKRAIDGKHIGYTHFYLHSNGRYVFLDNYVDFIPDHAHHIGLFNKDINLVEQCQ